MFLLDFYSSQNRVGGCNIRKKFQAIIDISTERQSGAYVHLVTFILPIFMLFVNNQASRFVMWIVPNQFQPYWIDAVKMEQLKCIYVYVLYILDFKEQWAMKNKAMCHIIFMVFIKHPL